MALLSREKKLTVTLLLTLGFFLAEITVGYLANSVALIADSFHMLSDLLALGIALYAIRLAQRKGATKENSFGFQRAEILGALVNAVFLLALCFTLILEAIQRFIKMEDMENPQLVLIVGGVGLAFNLIAVVLFSDVGHGHSHGGGHGNRKPSEPAKEEHSMEPNLPIFSNTNSDTDERNEETVQKNIIQLEIGKSYKARKNSPNKKPDSLTFSQGDSITVIKHLSNNTYLGSANGNQGKFSARQVRIPVPEDPEPSTHIQIENSQPLSYIESKEKPPAKENSSHGHSHHGGGANMRGILLHVAGDAMGSVGVIIAALVIWLTDYSWRFYLDPVMSLFITFLIMGSAIPLVRETSAILLQGVPNFDFEELKSRLRSIPGVKGIHEVHVWRLADNKLVGSCHMKVGDIKLGSTVASKAKEVFHLFDVHSSTIQTEFVDRSLSLGGSDLEASGNESQDDKACLLKCNTGCESTTCCEEEIRKP